MRRRARVKAALVDEVLVLVIVFLIGAMALPTGVLAVMAVPVGRLVNPLVPVLGISRTALTVVAVTVLGWALLRTLYRFLGSGSPSGQTPGKRLARVRVVGADSGVPPGYRGVIVRELVVAVETLSVVGLLAMLADPPWHDRVGRTRVEALEA